MACIQSASQMSSNLCRSVRGMENQQAIIVTRYTACGVPSTNAYQIVSAYQQHRLLDSVAELSQSLVTPPSSNSIKHTVLDQLELSKSPPYGIENQHESGD